MLRMSQNIEERSANTLINSEVLLEVPDKQELKPVIDSQMVEDDTESTASNNSIHSNSSTSESTENLSEHEGLKKN